MTKEVLLPEDKRDANKISKAKEQIFLLLDILNTQLNNNNYILGDDFSLADIPAGCWYNRCQKFNFDFSKFDGINQWFLKLQKREAYNSNVISAPLPPNSAVPTAPAPHARLTNRLRCPRLTRRRPIRARARAARGDPARCPRLSRRSTAR